MIFDKWRGILARDIDGKPLRIGDRAIVVSVRNAKQPSLKKLKGLVFTIVGASALDDFEFETDLPDPDNTGMTVFGRGKAVRKIKDDRTGTSDWSEIEKITGWKRNTKERKHEKV